MAMVRQLLTVMLGLAPVAACSPSSEQTSAKAVTMAERFAFSRNQAFADMGQEALNALSLTTPSLEGALVLEQNDQGQWVRLRGQWRLEAMAPPEGFRFRAPKALIEQPHLIRILEARLNDQVVRPTFQGTYWQLPLGPERATIELRFEVALNEWPEQPSQAQQWFKQGLTQLWQLLPSAELNTQEALVRLAKEEALLVDAWPWPMWEGGNVLSAVHLTVPAGFQALGTIHDTWRGLARGGLGLYLHRSPDVMELPGDQGIEVKLVNFGPEALPPLVKQAFERFRHDWGELYVSQLYLIKTPLLNGSEAHPGDAVVRTGLVVVPEARFLAPKAKDEDLRPIPPPSTSRRKIKEQVVDIVEASIAEHPAKSDAFTLTILDALALQWWLGGESELSQHALAKAMARHASLQLMAAHISPTYAERVRELHVKMPYQVAREGLNQEPVLYAADWTPGLLLQRGEGAAQLKLALAVDDLARLMGEPLWLEAERAMRKHPLGHWDFGQLRQWFMEEGPRIERVHAWLRAWLMEATADQLVGPLKAERVLELLVVDGAIDGLKRALVGELAGDGAVGEVLRGLLSQGSLIEGLSPETVSELLGLEVLDVSPWLKHAKGLLSEDGREKALFGLARDLLAPKANEAPTEAPHGKIKERVLTPMEAADIPVP